MPVHAYAASVKQDWAQLTITNGSADRRRCPGHLKFRVKARAGTPRGSAPTPGHCAAYDTAVMPVVAVLPREE